MGRTLEIKDSRVDSRRKRHSPSLSCHPVVRVERRSFSIFHFGKCKSNHTFFSPFLPPLCTAFLAPSLPLALHLSRLYSRDCLNSSLSSAFSASLRPPSPPPPPPPSVRRSFRPLNFQMHLWSATVAAAVAAAALNAVQVACLRLEAARRLSSVQGRRGGAMHTRTWNMSYCVTRRPASQIDKIPPMIVCRNRRDSALPRIGSK